MELTIPIRASGDMGPAVAHRLFYAGCRVVLHDRPRPSRCRRGMTFVDAPFNGVAILEASQAGVRRRPAKSRGPARPGFSRLV